MSGSAAQAPSPFRQPRAVYAVGFACVISFMGIGLVDPILPALASRLNASPAQVEHFGVHVPFLVGAGAVLAGTGLLATVRPALDAADAAEVLADDAAGADGQPGPVPVPG